MPSSRPVRACEVSAPAMAQGMHRPQCVSAKWLTATVLLAIVLAGGVTYYWRAVGADSGPMVTTATVTRGDVVETVDATGTLQAVTTVQVGTQVSGTIKALHADFNPRVRRGQVVAELEPSLFQTQVEQARASVVRLEAEARRAVVQLDDAQQKLSAGARAVGQGADSRVATSRPPRRPPARPPPPSRRPRPRSSRRAPSLNQSRGQSRPHDHPGADRRRRDLAQRRRRARPWRRACRRRRSS